MTDAVYKAMLSARPTTPPEGASMTTTQPAALPESATVLPDGSAFAIASYPLPADHWLYAPREYRDGEDDPIELPAPILNHRDHGDAVRAAIRYAVRSATMCGKEEDFDPDALVQNAMYALCGPFGAATLQAQPAAKCDGNHGGPRCADPECWNDDPPAQPAAAGVSDAEIRHDANLPFVEDEQGAEWVTLSPAMFARAVRRVLALRPQAVPMTDERLAEVIDAMAEARVTPFRPISHDEQADIRLRDFGLGNMPPGPIVMITEGGEQDPVAAAWKHAVPPRIWRPWHRRVNWGFAAVLAILYAIGRAIGSML